MCMNQSDSFCQRERERERERGDMGGGSYVAQGKIIKNVSLSLSLSLSLSHNSSGAHWLSR